jgi:hypothetical protein
MYISFVAAQKARQLPFDVGTGWFDWCGFSAPVQRLRYLFIRVPETIA